MSAAHVAAILDKFHVRDAHMHLLVKRMSHPQITRSNVNYKKIKNKGKGGGCLGQCPIASWCDQSLVYFYSAASARSIFSTSFYKKCKVTKINFGF